MAKETNKITKMPLEEMKNLIIARGGIRPAAESLGVHHSAIQGYLSTRKTNLADIMFEYQQQIAPHLLETREHIEGDCIVSADYHSPFVSLDWLERLLEVSRKEGIKQLLIAGDFFDFDRLSWWLKMAQAEEMATKLDDEFAFSEMVLERLEEWFDKIYLLGGNHWRRLLKSITYTVSSDRLMGLVGRKNDKRYVNIEYFDWILIDKKVRVTHPAKARKLDYTLARDLSILFPNQWLVVAHRHRVNEGFTPDGRPMLEIGWMGDTNRMRYIQHVDSTYYRWINGFGVYKNGQLKNITEYNYDWDKITNKP